MNERFPSTDKLKPLYELAIKFRKIKCWEYMEDTDIFGVVNPKNGEIGYVCILGNVKEVFGINVYLGPKGLDGYLKVLSGETYPGRINMFSTQYCLSLTYENLDFLDKRDIDTILELGIDTKGKILLPFFRSYIPGYYPWYLIEEETDFFKVVLEQAIDVCIRFKTNKSLFKTNKPNNYFVRSASENKGVTIWKDKLLKASSYKEEYEDTQINELKLKKIFKKTLQKEGVWEVGCDFFPLCINNKKSRPYMPLVFLCVDGLTGEILGHSLSSLRKNYLLLPEEILGLIDKLNKIPEILIVDKKDFINVLKPISDKLGISVRFKRNLLYYEEAANSLIDFLNKR
ncbi:MAG: hypothetical protein KJ568_02765 [Actinobacteria bacterium]|nr:hypothetical protein [Actinomycetota bacterium]